MNGRTLVNLPTYFELKRLARLVPARRGRHNALIGRRSSDQPALKQAVYVFGDGQSFGPKTTWAVLTHGRRHAHVQVHSQCQVRAARHLRVNLSTGPWIDATGRGHRHQVTPSARVLEAHAQLVTR